MARGQKPPLKAERRYKTPPKAEKPAKTKRTRRRKPARRTPLLLRPFVWLFRIFMRLFIRVGVLAAVILALVVGYNAMTLPPVQNLLDARARGSVTILDRNEQVFAWRGEQFGGQITADTVSPHLKNAIVATEDKRFYRHFGLSPRGIASAIRINLREGRGPFQGHGGSTITQQVAKLLCLGTEYDPSAGMTEAEFEADCRRTTIQRKAFEAIYALALETRYSKDEILTIYLNRAYLGAGSRGFEAASQRYFGKSANEVTPSESAMLAGLLVAPTRYAPTANLKRSQDRANVILGLMEDQGYLTAEQTSTARARPAELSEAAERRAGGYFADWVMEQGPSFLTRETTEDVIVHTTFDQRIQTAAEQALQSIFETKVKPGSKAQAAIVVMSSDGAVRAMVGGRKFKGVAGQFNRAIQAKRQTGSSFKPFVYAAALDLGYSPNDIVVDEPLTIDIPGSGPWSPQNYTRDYKGRVTLTDALAHSLNIPAVKISEFVGRENVRKIAEGFGIESDLADGPALALGVSESTLLEMTGAYAGILNGGSAVTPYGMIDLRIKGDPTPIIGQEGGVQERVISQRAARQLVYMMRETVLTGTGTRAQVGGHPVAGKTGTTQAQRDAWFIGFSADYVVGVWMGYDDNTPLTGVTGGGLPAEIFREAMAGIHQGMPTKPLPMTAPEPSRQVASGNDRGTSAQDRLRRGQTERRQPQTDNVVEQILLDVLGELFRRN
ncbi:transglycosylase domain-containing protein [Ovoidimarina sediminis]|uniref:transglycosylase domain-containing protein n=1 Tax=Ovoidimarina sediminis TaxID=3079856 RepID=UPI00290D82CA|nr:PBP1A family penicillin-binding protein [Rhodophyticola sp. MJ-SS7]MDU8943939.1 PBP1A family penicillin-binding protein [Rhodophyticola sp. MJ-SS7]